MIIGQPEPHPSEQDIRMKKKKERVNFLTLLLYIGLGLMIAFGVRLIIEPTVVVGHSMMPNLKDGQYMLNLKTAYQFGNPDYGDVVIVDTVDQNESAHYLIKRVIGLPGDTIEIKDNTLYRNGVKVMENYILEPMRNNNNLKVTLGEEEIWVMGDNRNNSMDSRAIGPVNYKRDIRGKVILRLYPFDQSFKDGHFE